MPDEVVLPLRQALRLSASVALVVLLVLVASGFDLDPPGAPFPPLLLWTLPVGAAVSLLFGFRAGNVAFAACVLAVVLYGRAHPAGSVQAMTARFALLLSLVTLQIFVWGFQSTFGRAQQLLRDQQRVIQLRVEEHARLVQTLVEDVRARLLSMASHFQADRFTGLDPLRAEQDELVSVLRRAQQSLLSDDRTQVVQPKLDFRQRVLQWILALTCLELVIMLTRRALGAPGPVAPGGALLAVTAGLWAVLRYRPRWRSTISLVFTLSSQAAIMAASAFWAFAGPPPGLVFVVTIAYQAVLIELPFSGLLVACLNLGVVGFAVSQHAASSTGAGVFLFSIAACALFMQGYWLLMTAWVSSSLRASEARGHELSRVEGFRTRICGTLFHDVANLVQGMRMLVALDEPQPDDVLAFQRLHARLAKLVTAAAETINDDGPLNERRLSRVSLEDVFREARELFAFRLQEKQQSLECLLPEPLSVTAQPDLLRDSVLANLLSNAIKFSPPGAVIQLGARRLSDAVEISVRDRGPGWPPELAERLARGAKVFSTQGSAGEQGLGLGLTLTREHLLRMGGGIALRRPDGGGGEAVIELRSADTAKPA